MSTREQIEDECRILAEAYLIANANRGRAEARIAFHPDDPATKEARFAAGLAESYAWDLFRGRSDDLTPIIGLLGVAEIRQDAIRIATAAGLAALKAELKAEAAVDAA